jgi:ligand-binding sensor domain-containing protein
MVRILWMRCLAIALAALVAVVVAATASAGGVPVQITPVADRLWVASNSGVQVVETTTGAVHRGPATTYPYATSVAWLGNTLWIASITNGYLAGAVEGFNAQTAAPLSSWIYDRHEAVYALGASGDTLWAWFGSPNANSHSTLVRFTTANTRPRRFPLQGRPGWMVATPKGLWFTDGKTLRTFGRFDSSARTIANAPAPSAPLAYGAGGVWLASGRTATRFDLTTRQPGASVRSQQPIILAAATRQALWLVTWNGSHAQLAAMTPGGRVTRSRSLSFIPSDLRSTDGHLWLGKSTGSPAVLEFDERSLRQERSITLG